MSNGNGSPSGAALESVTRLAAHRDPDDPLVDALQSIASELRDLRVEVAQLQTQVRRDTRLVRDDLRDLTERTRQIPIIKDMMVEVLTRVPEK
jgi:hypothetical protein